MKKPKMRNPQPMSSVASTWNEGYSRACEDWEAYHKWDIKENYIRKNELTQGDKWKQ